MVSGNGGFSEALYNNLHLLKNAHLKLVVADRKCGAFDFFYQNTNIPTFLVNSKDYNNKKEFEEIILRKFLMHNIKFIFLNYDRLIGEVLLDAYKGCIFNLHLSLLPFFKGFGAVEKSYQSEMLFYGATIHVVDRSIDGGPILGQVVIPKNILDDDDTFRNKLFRYAAILFIDQVYKIANQELVNKKDGQYCYKEACYGEGNFNPQLSINEHLVVL